ncbi:MAG: family 10 glycosylhydrolase [Cyanobacteria bacterium J06600_6]
MPISTKFLLHYSPPIAGGIKQSLIGLSKLILVTGILWLPQAVSQTAAAEDKPAPKQILTPLIPRQESFEEAITPGEARLMAQELSGLINRFKATLLTADATQSQVDVSTESVIRQRLESNTVTHKENTKLASSKYQNSHLALHRASRGLKRFKSLLKQRRYEAAKTEWSNAKQILWSYYPQDRLVAQSEVRAMWFDRGTIVKAKSEADLIEIFDRIAIAGINTVFFETLNSSYTIYPSKVAPEQNPLVKGWDPLKAAVKIAHERDIELHAWLWTFAAVNKRHNDILELPRHHLGPVLSQRPEWAMTDHQGSRFHYSSGKVFLDPANPEVRGYLQSLIAEIANNYDVDGIHLDYIRYPFQSPTGKLTYGYGKASREQFYHQTGYDPAQLNPYHPFWSKWIEFRTKQVDTFVSEVSQQLHQIDPDLTLSTAVFPMPERERLSKIQQGWETWVRKEWIDMLVPMTYAKDTERLHYLTSPLLREFTQGKALLLPGIRLLNMSEVGALDQMQLLRSLSTEGYSLFAAENLNSGLTTIFNQTQGDQLAESPGLPHREPFAAALSRYSSLQQEWNFWLATNPGTLNDRNLLEWGQQADRLSTELENFIDQPNSRNLFAVQVTLNSLRQRFPYWMKQTQNVDRYQAKAWKNRLDTLDRLLNYGLRKQFDRSTAKSG